MPPVPSLRLTLPVLTTAALALLTGPARAHFILNSPPAMTEQNGLGDPQKAPPCGDNGNAVPTGIVTAYSGGDKITISIDETIFHPGHYRVALAINDPSELPEPPPVTPNNTDCGTTIIQDPPIFPVLADGMLVHTEAFGSTQEFEVTLPTDVDCQNCTLQVIQFMSNHGLNNPGGCYYHHCANISISAIMGGTSGPDTSGNPETSGDATTEPGTTNASQGETTGEPGSSGSGDEPTTAGSAGSTGAATTTSDPTNDPTATVPATMTEPIDDDDSSACICSSDGNAGAPASLTLLALLALRPRRRR